jgi:peroxiredoxin
MVALAQPGPLGTVDVTGHTAAAANGTGIPNLLVHFADEKSARQLELLTRALRESGREDATTGVLAILSADQLSKAPYIPGVTYAEDRDGSWARALGVKDYKLPLTFIRGRKKEIVWKHEGELDSGAIAGALRKHLVAGGSVKMELVSSSLRTRRLPPNFLFEYAPGRQLTLRKLAGRPVKLVFWRTSSKPSIEAVREAETTKDSAGKQAPVVLAINDGDDRESAQRIAAENKLSATVVTDPDRKIATAYNVTMWPTVVSIDGLGVVRSIRYGRNGGDPVSAPARQTEQAK